MLEPAGVRIKNFDRQLELLREELSLAMSRRETASSEALAAGEEHRIAKESFERLKVMNPLFRRSAHERDLKDAQQREKRAIRASLAATLRESSAREEVEKIEGKIKELERDRRVLKNRMIDIEACYENNPESIIGMSQLWKCLERRVRLFDAEGPIAPSTIPLLLLETQALARPGCCMLLAGCSMAREFCRVIISTASAWSPSTRMPSRLSRA